MIHRRATVYKLSNENGFAEDGETNRRLGDWQVPEAAGVQIAPLPFTSNILLPGDST